MAAVRDPSPPSSAPIPARTRSPSAVAEPAMVQPSQSTRQRTAWCTTSAGSSSIRTPAANAANAPLTECSPVTDPLQSVIRKEILLYRLHGNDADYDDRTSVETRTLLDFVSHTPADDVPADVLHESTRCLLDHLGLAIAGAAEPAASDRQGAVPSARR